MGNKLLPRAPLLYVVCGLPGSGKSTVANLIGNWSRAAVLRSDEIRRACFPVRSYSTAESRIVYAEMLKRGKERLQRGEAVVLDGTFLAVRHRAEPLKLAGELGVPHRLILVTSSPSLIQQRLAARTDDPSEADYEIYLRLREQFEPFVEDHIRIENTGDLAALSVELAAKLGIGAG